jgi:phosphonate transport system substrate-binding protein
MNSYLANLRRLKITLTMLCAIIVALAACTPASTPAPTVAPTDKPAATAAEGKAIVIGDVGAKPTAIIDGTQPFADYLAGQLSAQGITKGVVKVAPDFATIADWLKTGQVDMIFQTPYPAVLLEDAVGAKTILRRWKGGDADYYTVIFARADSGMKTLADLKGHMMAVQDEYSTSSYMLPMAYVLEAGLRLTKKDSPDVTVAADEVGYTNSKSDDNTLQWVISGKVAAAGTDNRTYEKIPEETRKQLIILGETEKTPRNVLMVRADLDPALVEALKTVLLTMEKSEEGKAALKSYQSTAKFDELPGGPEGALARMRELSKLLKSGK